MPCALSTVFPAVSLPKEPVCRGQRSTLRLPGLKNRDCSSLRLLKSGLPIWANVFWTICNNYFCRTDFSPRSTCLFHMTGVSFLQRHQIFKTQADRCCFLSDTTGQSWRRQLKWSWKWHTSGKMPGGRGGIRTHGCFHIAGFQDRCIRPLCHPSGKKQIIQEDSVLELLCPASGPVQKGTFCCPKRKAGTKKGMGHVNKTGRVVVENRNEY